VRLPYRLNLESGTMEFSQSKSDPQVEGGTYFCGYWAKFYRVEKIVAGNDGFRWYTVTWEDGHVTHHCTSWDSRRDFVIVSGGPEIPESHPVFGEVPGEGRHFV